MPVGPFQRGDNFNEGSTDERPVHIVQMPGFFMDKTEVTRELWEQVKAWGNNNDYSISGGSYKGEGHPVHSVDWYDAVKWCNARSEREGLTPCYYTDDAHTLVYRTGDVNIGNSKVDWSADGYRLPTEAEWEMAARGGRTGQRFPHGDTISHADANFRNSGGESYQTGTTGYHPIWGSDTAPVGSFPANDYGLYDMAGNLWEWCWDSYDSGYYASPGSLSDPKGPDTGSYRVLRGGDWSGNAGSCRCAERGNNSPGNAYNISGFRTVRR